MDAKELKTIISLGENSRVEFKEHFSKTRLSHLQTAKAATSSSA